MRTVKLNKEGRAAIEEQLRRFREKFGRDPSGDDPVFFDPNSDTPKPYPAEQFRRETVEAMKKVGLAPEYIYAYSKTGLILTEQNRKLVPPSSLQEFYAAMDEFLDNPELARKWPAGPEENNAK